MLDNETGFGDEAGLDDFYPAVTRRVGTYLLLYDRYCVFSRNTQILYKEASIEQMPVLY